MNNYEFYLDELPKTMQQEIKSKLTPVIERDLYYGGREFTWDKNSKYEQWLKDNTDTTFGDRAVFVKLRH